MNESSPDTPLSDNPKPSATALVGMTNGRGSAGDLLPLLETRIRANPEDVRLLLKIAKTCQQAGRWNEALGYARRAESLEPSTDSFDLILDSLFRLGDREALNQILPVALTRASHDLGRAILSMHLMKDRQFIRSFALLREISLTSKSWYGHPVGRDADVPCWEGQRFDGRLLVIAEQALGEELLGSSSYGRIAAMGQETVVECDRRLIPLYQRSFPSIAFVPRATEELAKARKPGCRKTSISEAAGLMVCTDDNFCNPPGWIIADPERTAGLQGQYRQQWPGKVLVGISWHSFRPAWGSTHKSLKLADLAPLLGRRDIAFVSLQYGDVRDELTSLAASGLPAPTQDDTIDPMGDLEAFAAQIAAMDVIVTTSNTAAHLAGALGKPTVLMLHTTKGVFSYWCYDGESTPWYPTIRIVRGDAATPIQEFAEEVRQAVTNLTKAL